jgi:hypothetical protein
VDMKIPGVRALPKSKQKGIWHQRSALKHPP